MKKINYIIFFHILLAALCPNFSFGQVKEKQGYPDSARQFNAGFDVIILKNGDFIYGLVKEVDMYEIKYQRTDIPDGPIYVIPRNEVYAISYRNQVKDFLEPVGPIVTDPYLPDPTIDDAKELTKFRTSQERNVYVGIGLIRQFTKIDHPNDYSSSTIFPVLTIAYEMYKYNNLNIGLQMAVGSHKYTRQEYSTYDSAQSSVILKENIFTLNIYGKYSISSGSNVALRPYVLGGLGLQSSYIRAENKLQFVNNNNQAVIIKSGARSVGLGVLLRAGTEYFLNDNIRLFADAGIGATLIQAGLVLPIDNPKKN
jgi:opacity protein-like surface antigen